ncbi:MAG: hypothetical protein M3384_02185 [Acidobacteriota bacterium]|nr:hypothetical protein [Acidobacteriota bacterium]
MSNFSTPDSRISLRAVLLIGVLAGLLFSCGEGIRLFPFPPETAAAAQNGHSGAWKSGDRVGYQKNLHRFESGRQENPQSKIRRGDNQPQPSQQHYWANAYNTLNRAPYLALSAVVGETGVSFRARFFKSNPFSLSGASRAPPRCAS